MYINIKIDNMADADELTSKFQTMKTADHLDELTNIAREIFSKYNPTFFGDLNPRTQKLFGLWFESREIDDPSIMSFFDEDLQKFLRERREEQLKPRDGGSRRRRRSTPKSSRKYKKSSKRVFRKKSRSTRRR